jgi:hypothetical protein
MQMFQEKEEFLKHKSEIGRQWPSDEKLKINTLIVRGGTWHFPAVVNISESSNLVL